MGAIYLSASATDPATLFGGTWERIQDRFLLCAGSTYAAGATGGEAKHTLTVAEMPSHTHSASGGGTGTSSGSHIATTSGSYQSVSVGYAGNGSAHNNMPPYIAVYAWKRVA